MPLQGGLQVNMFEQVSSDHHQMSLAGPRSDDVWEVIPSFDVGGGGAA